MFTNCESLSWTHVTISYYMVLTAVGWWRCAWWGWTWWCLARLRNLRRRRLVLQNTSWEKNGCNCDGTKSESPVGSQRCFQDFLVCSPDKIIEESLHETQKKWQRWNPHLLHPGATNLPDHSLELCDLVISHPCKSISRICKCIYIYIHKRNTRCAWHQWNGVPESRRRRLVNASRAQLCSLPPGEANEMDGKTTQNSSINLHINRGLLHYEVNSSGLQVFDQRSCQDLQWLMELKDRDFHLIAWLEWHAQTSRTICGDCRSSASPAIVGFCHGKHYGIHNATLTIQPLRLKLRFMNPTLQELSCQGPGPPVRCNCLGCHSCKWCMVCQSINGLYEKMYRFKKMRISIFFWGLQVK